MSDRNNKGQFAPGNKAAVDRAAPRTQNEYISATINRVPLAKWDKVVDKALADAIAGDKDARRFLADYLLGKPPQILDLRSDQAALLSQVLERYTAHGKSVSEVLAVMLELVSGDEGDGVDDPDNDA